MNIVQIFEQFPTQEDCIAYRVHSAAQQLRLLGPGQLI